VASDSYWQSLTGRKVSRRAVLRAAAGVGAAGLAIAGCGGGEEAPVRPTPGVPEGVARAGGTVIMGAGGPPTFGLDPHTEVSTGLQVIPKVYGYMLHQDPRDESIIPDHAETWEQPDDVTYIVKLRPGIRYQNLPPVDGREVVAGDVLASFRRIIDNPLAPNKTWHTSVLESMEATDEHTLVFKTNRPYVYTWENLGLINAVIIPRELTDFAQVDLNTSGVGSGPFIIDRVSLKEQIEVVKNPDYFNQPLPYIDRQTWKIVMDDAIRVAAFRDRQIHIMANADRFEMEDIAKFSDEVRTFSKPELDYVSLGMRVDQAPFNDGRVREAIDIGLDRQEFIDKMTFGDGQILGPINQHLAEGFWSLPEDELEEAYQSGLSAEERTKKARDLVSAAGALGAKITVQTDTRQSSVDIATIMQSQLERLGFDVEVDVVELLAWFINLTQGNFHTTVLQHLPYESADIPTRYWYSLGTTEAGSWFGYANPEMDELIVKSWGQFDREERRETLLAAQRLMLQERGPMLNIYTGSTYLSAWRFVKNWRPELPGTLGEYNYELWLDV
jgi:peptide/nickel transport system substrate-binding protein